MAAIGEDFQGGQRRLYRATNPAGLWLASPSRLCWSFSTSCCRAGLAWLRSHSWLVATRQPRRCDQGFSDRYPSRVGVDRHRCMVSWPRCAAASPRRCSIFSGRSLAGSAGPALPSASSRACTCSSLPLYCFSASTFRNTNPPRAKISQIASALVKQAMFDIAHDPKLFMLVLPSVVIGAPLAEELVFRGQLFTALSQTRLGFCRNISRHIGGMVHAACFRSHGFRLPSFSSWAWCSAI